MSNFGTTDGWQPSTDKEEVTPISFDCTVVYAQNMTKPSEWSSKYEVVLGDISETAAAKLRAVGIDVKEPHPKKEALNSLNLTCKSKNYEITAIDHASGQPVESVGNGSKAIATVTPYAWEYQGKKGVSTNLRSLRITDLKVYEAPLTEAPVEVF